MTDGCCARLGGGAGVYNEGGTVRRCTIDGCTASGNIYDGLGLYQSSGTTEYCIITNNSYSACHGALRHPCPAGAFVSGGVLRVTSANLSGCRPATDAPAALADVGISADIVVDDGISPGGVASTVVKIDASGERTVLRQGPIAV